MAKRWAAKTILALVFLLFTAQQAFATNYLTSVGVQQVSITIGNGSTSATATITAVGTGAFIAWQGETTTDSTTFPSSEARVELTNTTTVTATRNTSSTDTITVNAVIVDGDTTNLIKSVQSGTTSIATAATTGTTTVSAVTNTNTAIFYLGQSTASTTSPLRVDCHVALSGTTVTATRATSNGVTICGWVVVEFQGAALNSSTQNVTVTTTASGTSFSTTITSVTTANTILAYGGFISSNSGAENKNYPRLSLASSTAVHADYNTAPSVTTGVSKVVVVEFVSGLLSQSVQRGTIALAAATSNTATITSSATAGTLCGYLGNSSNSSALAMNVTAAKITQTNATTVTFTSNSSQTATGSYECAQFPAFVAATTTGDAIWFGSTF